MTTIGFPLTGWYPFGFRSGSFLTSPFQQGSNSHFAKHQLRTVSRNATSVGLAVLFHELLQFPPVLRELPSLQHVDLGSDLNPIPLLHRKPALRRDGKPAPKNFTHTCASYGGNWAVHSREITNLTSMQNWTKKPTRQHLLQKHLIQPLVGRTPKNAQARVCGESLFANQKLPKSAVGGQHNPMFVSQSKGLCC